MQLMILNQKLNSHTQPKSRTKTPPSFLSLIAIHIANNDPL